jgi:hypothetical protein
MCTKRQLRSTGLQFGRKCKGVLRKREFGGIVTSVEFEHRVRAKANRSSGWFAPRSA